MAAKTKEEIQMEYTRLCANLGELELRRTSAQDALKEMNDTRNTIIQKIQNLQKSYDAMMVAEQNKPAPPPVEPQAPEAGVSPGEADVPQSQAAANG